MCSKKCKCSSLRPFSFALAAALTYGLAILLMSVAIMMGHAPAEVVALAPQMTWAVAFNHLLWAIVEGFIIGFVFALLYNLFCCCMAMCCRKSQEGSCGCGSADKKPE